ncbi:lipocalin-like domain-containing protein [Chloroflexota bacterium]
MQDSIVGTWRIVSTEVRSEDGHVSYPDGHNSRGYLIYSDDGYFSITIMKSDRSRYASDDFRGGTTEELAKAAETYVAYCGRYSLSESSVTHHIDASLFPNWVGADQQRFIEFDGDKLLLSTPPFLIYDKQQRAYLIWERANPFA